MLSQLVPRLPMMACWECCAGVELKAAVEEWQRKRNVPEPRLTTGFLEGTHPVVDVYELKVSIQGPHVSLSTGP